MKAVLMCTITTPMRGQESQRSRLKSCELHSTKSKNKSPDSNGIRSDDIKGRDDETRKLMRQIFNEITKRNGFASEAWKKKKIKVTHRKSGKC